MKSRTCWRQLTTWTQRRHLMQWAAAAAAAADWQHSPSSRHRTTHVDKRSPVKLTPTHIPNRRLQGGLAHLLRRSIYMRMVTWLCPRQRKQHHRLAAHPPKCPVLALALTTTTTTLRRQPRYAGPDQHTHSANELTHHVHAVNQTSPRLLVNVAFASFTSESAISAFCGKLPIKFLPQKQ